MDKIIKLDFENTSSIRTTEDIYCEVYSHDRNNAIFEIGVEGITNEKPVALFYFTKSKEYSKVLGTVEDEKIKIVFDNKLITRNEKVICFLYLDSEEKDADVYRFKFDVRLSEIDKVNTLPIKERIKIENLDVVTREELQEALEKVSRGDIDVSGLLTEEQANAKYITKEDLIDKDFATVSQLEKVHEDSVGRSELEKYVTKEELANSQPTVDTSNLATKEEVEKVKSSVETLNNISIKKSELSKKVDKTDFEELKGKVLTDESLTSYVKREELPPQVNGEELRRELTQTLSLNGNILTISNGNSVALPKTVDEDRINRRLDTLENNSKLDNNLLLNSGNKVSNKFYPTTRFKLSEQPKIGNTYTLTVKANLPTSKTGVVVQVANNVSLGTLTKVGEGLYSLTFEWNAKVQASYELVVYITPNNSVEVEVEWAKLVEGRDTDYTWYPNYDELSNIYTFVEQASLAIESSGNLLDNTLKERAGANEFLNYADITNAIDTYGVGKYTLSFEMKSATAGNVGVYISGNPKYTFTQLSLPTTTEYQKFLLHIDVTLNNDKNTTSNLSFYGGKYGNGVIPSVRKLRLSKGFYKNLNWKPSDSELATIFEKIGG